VFFSALLVSPERQAMPPKALTPFPGHGSIPGMTRPLRIEQGGRYHATGRGNERRNNSATAPTAFTSWDCLPKNLWAASQQSTKTFVLGAASIP
jgi:hypothetical protein